MANARRGNISNAVNEALLLEAHELIHSGDLSSTPLEGMLENDLKSGDLEALWQHLIEARNFLREE